MNNYYRITGYEPKNDFSFIIDSNGMFEKLWQFSSYLISKDIDVLEVSKLENMIDVNIEPIEEDANHIYLQASKIGKPEKISHIINGITYEAIKIGDKIYIPDNTKTL